MVVDLHIQHIAKGYKSFSPSDALVYQTDYFVLTLNKYRRAKGKSIDFVHGVGKGVLRAELIKVLESKFPLFEYQDAPFSTYGYQGAIRVTIR